jgi:hypothetical protein
VGDVVVFGSRQTEEGTKSPALPLVYKRVSVRIVKSDLEIVSPLVKKPVSKLDPKLLHISSRTVTRAALGELVSAR